jgi:threonine dehydratase
MAMRARDWGRELERAVARLEGVSAVTPIYCSAGLDAKAGAQVLCKDEGLQITGSFKLRGAWNAVAARQRPGVARGLITYSSGNFGRALAYTAQRHGLRCVVVTPSDATKEKIAAMRRLGARVVLHHPSEDRNQITRQEARAQRLALVPPYDDPHVIAGQGTVGVELIEQVAQLDALVVPLGGGGLLAGCALAARASGSGARLYGVEPAARPKTLRSLRSGRRETVPARPTIADALKVTQPGVITFPIVRELVEDVLTVTDAELANAMRAAKWQLGARVEPGAAAGLAAVLNRQIPGSPERIGVVLTGSMPTMASCVRSGARGTRAPVPRRRRGGAKAATQRRRRIR